MAHRVEPAPCRQRPGWLRRAAENPARTDFLQGECVRRVVFAAPLHVLFGGGDDAAMNRRHYGDMAAVRPIWPGREGIAAAIEIAPDQNIAGYWRCAGAIAIHDKVGGVVGREPEVGRVTPAGAAPVGGAVAKRPGREAHDQLGALECPAVAIVGGRAAMPDAIATDIGAIGGDAIEAIGADIYAEPAARRAMSAQDGTTPR